MGGGNGLKINQHKKRSKKQRINSRTIKSAESAQNRGSQPSSRPPRGKKAGMVCIIFSRYRPHTYSNAPSVLRRRSSANNFFMYLRRPGTTSEVTLPRGWAWLSPTPAVMVMVDWLLLLLCWLLRPFSHRPTALDRARCPCTGASPSKSHMARVVIPIYSFRTSRSTNQVHPKYMLPGAMSRCKLRFPSQ